MKIIDLNNAEKLDIANETFSNSDAQNASTSNAAFPSLNLLTPSPEKLAAIKKQMEYQNALKALKEAEDKKKRDDLMNQISMIEAEQAKIKAEQQKLEAELALKQQERQTSGAGKFLGMPIPLAIGLGIIISFGIYKIVKK